MINAVIQECDDPKRTFLRQTVALGPMVLALTQFGCATMPRMEALPDSGVQCPAPGLQVKPAYPRDAEMLAAFIQVSELLTGVGQLSEALAREYLERVATHPKLTAALPRLLQAFAKMNSGGAEPGEPELQRYVFQDAELAETAQQLIYLWYVSAFFLPAENGSGERQWWYGSAEQYRQALFWRVVQAHPPMTPTPGDWAKRPESARSQQPENKT